MSNYVVNAPYVTLTVEDANGNEVVLGFYAGNVVENPVENAAFDKHVRTGLIEKASPDDAFGSGAAAPEGQPPSDGQVPPADDEPSEAPAGNASLEDWQEYARTRGATDSDLEGKSRNDLRDSYGA